jgi:hypothetical protein
MMTSMAHEMAEINKTMKNLSIHFNTNITKPTGNPTCQRREKAPETQYPMHSEMSKLGNHTQTIKALTGEEKKAMQSKIKEEEDLK